MVFMDERTPVGVRRNDADCANTFCKAPYFIYPFLCIFAELELLDAAARLDGGYGFKR